MTTLDLPQDAEAGLSGHVADHDKIRVALAALNNAKIETLTAGTVTAGAAGTDPVLTLVDLGGGAYRVDMTIPAGPPGATGGPGAPGDPGPAGPGMPTGGTTGQYPKKASNADHDYTFGVPTAAEVGAVPTARTITAGTGLTGGGDLSANRTLSVAYGTTSGTALEGTQLGAAKALTGATLQARLAGGTTSGAPATGTFAVRDVVVSAAGEVWVCTVAGSPGTWVKASNTQNAIVLDVGAAVPGGTATDTIIVRR